MQPERFTTVYVKDLADQAERFMLMSYERLPRTLVLHNDSWALALAGHAREIALRRAGAGPELPHLVRCISLLEACRYWRVGTALKSRAAIIQEFQEWAGPDYLPLQVQLSAALPSASGPTAKEIEEVLYDAQLAQRLLAGIEGADLSWLEDRYQHPSPRPRSQYLTAYLEELREARFRSGHLRRQYQHTHSAVLLDLQRIVDELREEDRAEQKPEPPAPEPVGQTYFRTVFANYNEHHRLVDRKAAILIGINCLLVVALVLLIAYRDWAIDQPELLFPTCLFVLCAITSTTYAVLAIRPSTGQEVEVNLADHTYFSRLTAEEFGDRMEAVLKQPDRLYKTLTTELYNYGKRLTYRHAKLDTSFMMLTVGLAGGLVLLAAVLLF